MAIVHYEAITLHHRVDRQFQAWEKLLPSEPAKTQQHLLWLHGGLISDVYSGPAFGRLLPVLSSVVLFAILWLAPVLTLVFLQAVVMPVHSEWLSSSIRASLLIIVLVIIYSALQGRSSERQAKQSRLRIRGGTFIAAGVCSVGVFSSLHVLLWPGELLQRGQAAFFPASMVWDPQVDSSKTYRYFMWMQCGERLDQDNSWAQGYANYRYVTGSYTVDENFGNTSYGSWKRKPFDINKPQSERVDYGANTSYFSPSTLGWSCPTGDEKTVISTQLLRAWITDISQRFSPNYILKAVIINGGNLTAEERGHLNTHTKNQPLHPKFPAVLEQVPWLDLSSEDLRFASFCNAWMPKVRLPDARLLKGANFCGANLQGVHLSEWKEARNESAAFFGSQLNGVDLSGGFLFVASRTIIRTSVEQFGV